MADLSKIKTQRANKRRKLTNIKKRIDELSTEDPRSLVPEKLDKIKAELTREIEAHRELQTQYEEILSAETGTHAAENYEHELASGDDHHDTYAQYDSELDDLIYFCSMSHKAKGLKTTYDRWRDSHDPEAERFLTDCQELLDAMKSFMTDTESRSDHRHVRGDREDFDRFIRDVREEVNTVKKPAPKAEPSKSSSNYQTKFNLSLPSFHGEPSKWLSFYKLFTSTMKKRGGDLTEEEKKCILLDAMKAPEPQSIVELQSKLDDGYERALTALDKKYGSPHVLIPDMTKKMLKKTLFTYSTQGITDLLTQFFVPYQQMTEKGVDLSSFLFYVAISMCDDKLKEGWAERNRGDEDLPTMEKLKDYLEPLSMTLTVKATPAVVSSDPVSVKSKPNIKQKPASAGNRPSSTASSSARQCVLCHEPLHSLTRCPTFLGYSVDQRSKFVRENKWCSNCLHLSHLVQNCSSSGTCRTCNGKHHTFLHRGGANTSTTTNATTSGNSATSLMSVSGTRTVKPKSKVSPPTHSFLHTAVVTAVNGWRTRRSRLAMDSGSSTSLITEALVAQLKLKRHSQRLQLSGPYGGSHSRHFVDIQLRSIHDPDKDIRLKLSVVKKLPVSTPPVHGSVLVSELNSRNLTLADPDFGGPLDLLIGTLDSFKCQSGIPTLIPDHNLVVTPTIFGDAVSGPLSPGQVANVFNVQATSDDLSQSLSRLWEMDQVPEVCNLSVEDKAAVDQFYEHLDIKEDGRYQVKLPRSEDPPTLGKSRHIAISRFRSNEVSLQKKGKLPEFTAALSEYLTLDHAEKIPASSVKTDLPTYYLPVHGVFKETSSTTKVRPVFDASAKTTTGSSLNDTLLTGPNLYPLLPDVIIQFRSHALGMSADISKMFREILLDPSDRDLHRFVMRDEHGEITDYRMKRLTFGVKPSPSWPLRSSGTWR